MPYVIIHVLFRGTLFHWTKKEYKGWATFRIEESTMQKEYMFLSPATKALRKVDRKWDMHGTII